MTRNKLQKTRKPRPYEIREVVNYTDKGFTLLTEQAIRMSAADDMHRALTLVVDNAHDFSRKWLHEESGFARTILDALARANGEIT